MCIRGFDFFVLSLDLCSLSVFLLFTTDSFKEATQVRM